MSAFSLILSILPAIFYGKKHGSLLAIKCGRYGREISKLCESKLHFSNFKFRTEGYGFVKVNLALHSDSDGLGCKSSGARKALSTNTEAVK